ncbi:MAG: DUF3160 domain-containing protein, partial [Polyangiales bacterium]
MHHAASRDVRIPQVSLALLVACSPGPGRTPPEATPPPPMPVTTTTTVPACTRVAAAEVEPIYQAGLDPNGAEYDAADACAVSEGGLRQAGDAILGHRADRPATKATRFDHKVMPKRLDEVSKRLALSPDERAHLMKDGFVVPARFADGDYVLALHEIYQSELPLYVSADAILHAVYASNDKLIAKIESGSLSPKLWTFLESLHCALADQYSTLPKDVARDLDVYISVARSLLADKAVPSVLGNDAEVARLAALAKSAGGLGSQDLFGRARMIDFTTYRPRGHYAAEAAGDNPDHANLEAYFRAATWLSRIEFNVVSRSCISSEADGSTAQTPRESADAIALGRLIDKAGLGPDLESFDRAWGLLAGKREDVPFVELARVAQAA